MLKALLGGLAISRAAMRARIVARLTMRRAAALSVLYTLAGVLFLTGIGFLLAGLFMVSAIYLGPMFTALLFGAVFMLFGLIAVLVARAKSAHPAKHRAEATEAAAAEAAKMPHPPESFADDIKAGMREHAMPLALAALAAGLATGATAGRRRRRGNGHAQE